MGNLPDSLKITLGGESGESERVSAHFTGDQLSSLLCCNATPCITLGEFEYLTAYLDTWAHENGSSLTVSSGVIRFQKKKKTRQAKEAICCP